MIHLDLSPEDARLLRDVLESYLGDLRMEIAGTESLSFRENLKKTEVLLKTLILHLRDAS